MTNVSPRIRLDPWSAEYEGAIQLGDGGLEPPRVDIRVESAVWEAIRPPAGPSAGCLAFVDGVRRIEHRLLVEDGDRTVFGLLGSYGVGAAVVDMTARVARETVGRVAVTGAGLRLPPFAAPIGDGRAGVLFDPVSEPENTPAAPVEGLQKAMRAGEAGLAERLAAEVDVVFLDGPLTYVTAAARLTEADDERAVGWIGQAFGVDAREAAVSGKPIRRTLLRWAQATLTESKLPD